MSTGSDVQEAQAGGDLKVLCVLFLFWSALVILLDPPRWENSPESHRLVTDPSHFVFLISIALWVRWPAGRFLAVACTWFHLLCAGALFLQVFPVANLGIHGPRILPNAPTGAVRLLIVPWILALMWQLRTLRRPEIRALFVSRREIKEDSKPSPGY